MQGKVPYEYFETFFGQKNDFPKPHVITRLIEDVYEDIINRSDDAYEDQWRDELEIYNNLSWWEKRKVSRPICNWTVRTDPIEYFSSQSQTFRDFEKRLKNLQVLVDVMKMASVCKNQVWVNSFELRALENVYNNVDNYIFLQDDVVGYLEKFK